jgi:Lar family restriction alleviation protein
VSNEAIQQPRTSLLACPFCGGVGQINVPVKLNDVPVYSIRCVSCDAQTGWQVTADDAAAKWNTRAADGGNGK